ncbi:MFS general substrate transporter [Polyplosphaeria fusca]|uniref:MFS general substrate transporter n=1 Tax=Polyplosphaeria fusca TaxID=682080 RepID=A0A9P4V529_9PLEO|nr:MFS general substrate transporter [Polyplosphaeria fusca]
MLPKWKSRKPSEDATSGESSTNAKEEAPFAGRKWYLGILGDKLTDEVPGSVILLSGATKRNEPLGLQHEHARTSASSLPSPYRSPNRSASRGSRRSTRSKPKEKKKSKDGKFILEPQPDDSANDPLNWPTLRRDIALLSLGFYCMVGGGMTPILAAGFNNVAATYDITVPQVALTTGLYMLGLGIGSIIASPTAILFGKRPVYLVAIIIFLLSAVWCALAPNYASLVVARIVQGLAVSPVECLPSATVAEIFFLHERAYRLGVYTLLLLGGKNLIPLVSAAIIQAKGWEWVFWVVAIVVGFCFFLIFFFVPETFWDRAPRPRGRSRHGKHLHMHLPGHEHRKSAQTLDRGDAGHVSPMATPLSPPLSPISPGPESPRRHKTAHFAEPGDDIAATHQDDKSKQGAPQEDYFGHVGMSKAPSPSVPAPAPTSTDPEKQDHVPGTPTDDGQSDRLSIRYTDYYREAPAKSYVQSLKPWNGRLVKDSWFKIMIRPFILFAYPAVLWSSMVYALAVGWLIVLSESIAHIYQDRESYNFTSLQVGLVYISPFVGGVLGTAVAGKVSDLIVRYMARKNDGVYEPEFRLVMAIPIALSTVIGLMGFGWSAEEKDAWIVPTIFFGIISFGCSLASTTAITFVVDSYRQYAGEALVTLNVSKSESISLDMACRKLIRCRYPSWIHLLSLLHPLARI